MNSIATENPGVLYISSNKLDEKQVDSIMQRLFKKAQRILGTVNTKYTLNVVKVGGVNLYTYVFVEDRSLVNIMAGLNKDGTLLVKKELDNKCKFARYKKHDLEKEKDKKLKDLHAQFFGPEKLKGHGTPYFGGAFGGPGKKMLWSDYQEQEDDIMHEYEPQYKYTKLNPLWETYNDSVHKDVKVLLATAKEPDNHVNNTVLEAINVPEWITPELIREHVKKYDTKGRYRLRWINRTEFVEDYYPIVTKTDDKIRVQFDPNTNDALYAIHMIRKLNIKQGNNTHCLIFNLPRL